MAHPSTIAEQGRSLLRVDRNIYERLGTLSYNGRLVGFQARLLYPLLVDLDPERVFTY
jgi:hypothetical protein